MNRRREVRILVVEADRSAWPRIGAFFAAQLAQVGAEARPVFRDHLPQRALGFHLASLTDRVGGRSVAHLLLDRPALLEDFKDTPIVNIHAPAPGSMHADLRALLGREGAGLAPDGLWVFARDWMAPWFQDPLEFPELGLALVPRPEPVSADRTWERRSIAAADLRATGLRLALS